VVKNKVAPPFRSTEFDLMFNEGISYEGDLINTGMKYGVVKKTGNTYSFSGEKLGVGMEASKDALRADKKMLKEIEKELTASVNKVVSPEPETESSLKK
jgi:recombination protein RecA